MPRFKNPPIVQAWLAFDFEPRADKVAWDMTRAQEFTKLEENSFPKVEVVIRQEYKLEESHSGKLPRVVSQERVPEVVRMWEADSKRVLQIADDRMAYNVLEGGSKYPGFETLMRESLEYLEKYREFFQPAGIRQATIHYADIINIPKTTIELDDYFTVTRELPEDPFGLITGFTTRYETRCPSDDEPLQFSLSMIPSATTGTLRFHMSWEKRCGKIDFTGYETLRVGLYESHEFMVDCFEKSITQTTRDLFNPQDV